MFSTLLVFLMYMLSQMDVFYYENKTLFLNQCDNQENYSSVCCGIEEKKMKVQLIFPFLDI